MTTVVEFTGRAARRCNGGDEPGELVIEYEHSQDTQTLWLDTESLLPLRWEASGPNSYDYHLTFNYERIDLRRPSGAKAPDCIP